VNVSVELKRRARQLRKTTTSAERILWRQLHARQIAGFRFRRQVSLCGFIVDFACYGARLVIEVDGATHSTDEEIERDTARDATLRTNGDAVLRFTNDEVFHNIEGVFETIRLKLDELRPRLHEDDVQGLRDPPP
jgi:very-short-patch-repair endonuclease